MKKLIFVIMLVFLLSGCSNQKDIDNISYVMALGVDISETDDYIITFLTAIPQNGSKDKKTSTESFSVSASNVYSASNSLASNLNKKIDFSHCRIIVFSKDVSKKGLSFFKKTLLNEKSFRPNTLSAISKNQAKEYLNSDMIKEQENPARYFEMLFNSKNSPDTLGFTIKDFYTKKESVIPLIDESGIAGSVILKDDAVLTDLSKRQTSVYKLLTGDFSHSYLSFDDDTSVISLFQDKSPQIIVSKDITKPISITLYLSGELITEKSSKDQNDYIESLKKECEDFIDFTKNELNCDVLGIYNRVRLKFPTNKALENYDFYSKYRNYNFSVKIVYHPIITTERDFDL